MNAAIINFLLNATTMMHYVLCVHKYILRVYTRNQCQQHAFLYTWFNFIKVQFLDMACDACPRKQLCNRSFFFSRKTKILSSTVAVVVGNVARNVVCFSCKFFQCRSVSTREEKYCLAFLHLLAHTHQHIACLIFIIWAAFELDYFLRRKNSSNECITYLHFF